MVVRLGFLGNSRVVVSHVGGGIECTFHTLVGCRNYSKKETRMELEGGGKGGNKFLCGTKGPPFIFSNFIHTLWC